MFSGAGAGTNEQSSANMRRPPLGDAPKPTDKSVKAYKTFHGTEPPSLDWNGDFRAAAEDTGRQAAMHGRAGPGTTTDKEDIES